MTSCCCIAFSVVTSGLSNGWLSSAAKIARAEEVIDWLFSVAVADMNLQSVQFPGLEALRTKLRRALPEPSWVSIAFAVRTTAASLIALYIAFRMNLDDPKSSPT
ncbi:hypothetical protein ATN79_29125 [Paraburkholderia caribensis]|nr:hypothetical protein ATN79_29125 [Paraburkholderia caribensis]CAG9213296.1 conserved hypothetical protein [Paraburkholderia caribensis]